MVIFSVRILFITATSILSSCVRVCPVVLGVLGFSVTILRFISVRRFLFVWFFCFQ